MRSIRSYKGVLPTLNERVYIDNSSVLVGDITIENDASIWPLCAAWGAPRKAAIFLLLLTNFKSVLHVTHKNNHNPNGYPLLIGNDVTIGHKVMLHGCTIHDRVLVGMGSIILDGAIIESDVMIGHRGIAGHEKTTSK